MNRLKHGIHEFFYTLLAYPRAWRFMVNYRLWEGLRDYGWVARMLVGIGILMAMYMFSDIWDWYESHDEMSLSAMMIGQDSVLLRWSKAVYNSMSEGVLNWVTLILLEVVIYHFMRRTLQIILKKNVENAHTFKPFFDAQKRMIVVSILAMMFEGLLVNILTEEESGWWYLTVYTVVHSLLLGWVIADNYNEQFGLTIRQSARNIRLHYIGICLGLGFPLMLMLEVPIIGTVLGPLAASVTAAIVLREKSDLHIIGYQMSEKERKKAEKEAARAAKKAARKARKKGVELVS